MPLLLSTSWNAFRHRSAGKLIFEIKKAGFGSVELSFNLTLPMVKAIGRMVRHKEISVGSLHNFCPVPDGVRRAIALPDYYSLSSGDASRRKAAIKYTKRTIRTAAGLGAGAVVLHTGRVEIPDHTRQLIGLYEKGLKGSRQYALLKAKMVQQRNKYSRIYFENTLKSLDEISCYARRSKIKLGVENRFYYREIPSFEEIGKILREFRGGTIHYWHDTGHAQIMENLGFVRQKDFLDAYGGRLLGMHIHNVSGCEDHLPPCRGDLDFRFFKLYLKPATIKVVEAHYPATAEELVKSRLMLEKIFDGRQ